MTLVKINGEELEVTVDAPGAALTDVCSEALRVHRAVCRGTAARERADEKRLAAKAVRLGGPLFGFKVPDEPAEEDTEDDDDVS